MIILPLLPILLKQFAGSVGQITFRSPPVSRPKRGAYRDRHGRWARDAMDASGSARRARPSVRRNRVVPIPRRWDQAGDDACASRRPRWLTSPDTGENTYKPLA